MSTVKLLEREYSSPESLTARLPGLRWITLLPISLLWFAFNFHWAALGFIILPSQVLKIAGLLDKGQALATVLVPGAFAALLVNPLAGMLSDRTRGKLARWGRRRPYIGLGTVLNIVALLWMANAWDIPTLAIAYIAVQCSNNLIAAPFHALFPDLVPQEQRGIASGAMSIMGVGGTMCGVVVAGLLVDASRPLSVYRQEVGLAYGCIIAVLVALVSITLRTVHERGALPEVEEPAQGKTAKGGDALWRAKYFAWLTPSLLCSIAGTTLVVVVVWGSMTVWNFFRVAGLQVGSDVQQCVLMVVLALAILRLFGFNPRRNGDFAWVLITRLLMMIGIYTIQIFLQYYMHDVVGVPDPEQQTSRFILIASIAGLASALIAGWLSDRLGRKRIIYFSGGLLALLGLTIIVSNLFTPSLQMILVAAALFGVGSGAYQSVDWALVADVLPSHKNYARDMGVWNIALSLPQVIAPLVGGSLIDAFTRRGLPVLGFQTLFMLAVVCCLMGTVTVRYIRGVKR